MVVTVIFYVKSVGPAALEQEIGEIAYEKCAWYRRIASIAFFLIFVNYVIYYFFPLSTPLPRRFPWDYILTASIATVILIPSLYLMYRGVKDAGEETLTPKKEHTLYGGIYETIRHPQALGEVWVALAMALYLNSPLLALVSLFYFPAFYYFSIAEERDLVIRYGQAYVEYKKRTPMFIPRRTNRRDPES
ncbi:MAG: methyltransferase family protein [Candidatus Thorarchaeota archaeon]|jgi:protein-S-isoprenylcysteine O-methyltransferase Ste14